MTGRSRVHYSWVVAAVTFATLLMTSGFRGLPGLLFAPLEREFGWSRSTVSLAVSVNLLLFGLGGPFASALLNRYGVRRVIGWALVTIAAGSGLTVLIDAPWQLTPLWGVVVGLATAAISVPLAATIAGYSEGYADNVSLVLR